jgi:hypothetical protein
MTLFELHTNEGRRFVRSTPERLREAMAEYIKAKRARGYSLSSIIYCWFPIYLETI